MVEEIYDNDLAGMMCPLDFGALLGPPPSSRSDGNICLRGAQRYIKIIFFNSLNKKIK